MLKQVPLSLRLAIKGLLLNRGFSAAMLLNIALGVLGYLVVEGFNDSFLAEMAERTQSTAAGDLVVSTRVKPTEDVLQAIQAQIPQEATLSVEQSLLTMAAGPKASRLIEVRFIDGRFPLYGAMTLTQSGKQKPEAASLLKGTHDAWLYPELQSQLGVKAGDTMKIGGVSYRITDFVADDPTASGLGFTLAPRAYVSIETAEETGLMSLGSRVQWVWRYKLPPHIDPDTLEQSLRQSIHDKSIRIRSHRNSTDEFARLQRYLNDYLGLVALSALFLATVGTSYMLRGQLVRTIKDFAVLRSLGAKIQLPITVFTLQAVILGIAGALLATLLSRMLLPLLAELMAPITGPLTVSSLSSSTISAAIVLAVSGGVLMALPLLRRLALLKPAFLFQETSVPSLVLSWQTGLWYVPALAVWWLASVWEAHSWRNGSIFAVSVLGSALILGLVGYAILKFLTMTLPRLHMNWQFKLPLTQIARSPLASISTFLALALGTTLMNVIPQLRASIAKEIERPDSVVPQFFMFDIQDEQLQGLKNFFSTRSFQLKEPSALIRAELSAINNQAADERQVSLEGEREQEQREGLQNRMQNLSFRKQLSPSETLVDGTFVGETWNGEGIPAMSLEQEYARRLSLRIGDVMKFDVSGIPVEGKITSLRKVRWTSFEPNFFILFQPGVLEEAPKIWVVSASGIPENARETAQSEIVQNWPNISIVDVKATVRRLLVMVDQISSAISFVAVLALIAGLGVLMAIVSHQANERRLSFALLKTLGAKSDKIMQIYLFEYLLLAVGAIALGTLLSLVLSIVLSLYVFKTGVTVHWLVPSLIAATVLPVSLILTYLFSRSALNASVNKLLQ